MIPRRRRRAAACRRSCTPYDTSHLKAPGRGRRLNLQKGTINVPKGQEGGAMQITRQADYAVRAVLYLAEMGDSGRAPTSQIARKQPIPPSFLAKIVSQLSVAGVLPP